MLEDDRNVCGLKKGHLDSRRFIYEGELKETSINFKLNSKQLIENSKELPLTRSPLNVSVPSFYP